MARNDYEYEKTNEILTELEAYEEGNGLFSCFGITPRGMIIYFDEIGSPHRVKANGSRLERGALINLGKLPIEVISTKEAFRHLAEQARQGYINQLETAHYHSQNRLADRIVQRWRTIAATGLVVFALFGWLFYSNNGNLTQTIGQAESRLKDFYAERGVYVAGYKDIPMIVTPGGYSPLGPVSITKEVFRDFLKETNSPAFAEADQMYAVCVQEGCDPAVALAFFEHESSAGKNGVASYTKSIGNIRCTRGYDCFVTEGNGSFRRYKTWSDGLRDWVELLKFYKDDWKLVTLEEIIPRYAPQEDNNDEALYIATVKGRVDKLRQRVVLPVAVVNNNNNTQIEIKEPDYKTVVVSDLPIGNPVYEEDAVITQGYSAKHPEIDIARPIAVALGTQIHTTIGGIITVVKDDPLFGNRVFVGNSQFSAHYNHLTANIPVESGQIVKRGDVIGYMGNSGKSTGPHLDYELFQGKNRLNPMDWVFRKQ